MVSPHSRRATDAARALLAMLAVIAAPGAVRAAPPGAPLAQQRVVLADPDPELHHAVEQALAPYHLQVILEGPAPSDDSVAQQRADADTARFVVWREGEQLVVYDRQLGSTERRDSRAGVLDPPTAAAAALTIKTMMRLPPPRGDEPPPAPPAAGPAGSAGPAEPAGIELRIQAGIAGRIARSDDTSTSSRVGGAVAIRPWPSAGVRLGIAGDLGSSTAVDRASFKGTFSDWTALGVVSWTYALGALELEPHAGFGIRRSALDGTEMSNPRSETATLATARAGMWVRLRYARYTIGASVSADEVFGTPTYTKTNSPAEVFQVPASGIELGAVIAVDL